jgi:pRiA4b ORF-3-like protein
LRWWSLILKALAPDSILARGTRLKDRRMILALTVECAVGAYLKEQCIRTIEIDEEARLYDLHEAIQDAVQFGRDHPFQFFLANSASPSARKQWLTEKEEWEDKEDDFRRIILKDIYPLGRKRLYYLFDFGDRWTFEIRKHRKTKEPEAGVKYPRVVKRIGPNPEQYPNYEE